MKMTSKERMLAAFRKQKADSVPVAPDMSNMIPSRLTGKPFWDIYLHQTPPLWKAYLDAVKYFKFDAWFIYSGLGLQEKRNYTVDYKVISEENDRRVQLGVFKTLDGELTQETTFFRADPPSMTKKMFTEFDKQLKIFKHLLPEITGYDDSELKLHMKEVGDLGVVGAGVGISGFQEIISLFNDGLEGATFAYYDHYDKLKEMCDLMDKRTLKITEMTLDAKPDFFMIGASGIWTLQSDEIFRDLSLPILKKVTRMCKEAGIVSFMHSCGKQRKMLDIIAKETDLDVVNPLEMPPMGDCDLAEVKKSLGHRFALMGNLHTTETMLKGTPADVEREAKKAIDAAGANGGFVLSTGDQCGRDTPDENIFKLVEVARTYGKY